MWRIFVSSYFNIDLIIFLLLFRCLSTLDGFFDNIGLFVCVYSVLCFFVASSIEMNNTAPRERFSFRFNCWRERFCCIPIWKKEANAVQVIVGDKMIFVSFCILCFQFLLVLINRFHSFLRTTVFVLNRILSENQQRLKLQMDTFRVWHTSVSIRSTKR